MNVKHTPLPLSYLRGDNEYVLIDGEKNAIAHFLYASEYLREIRLRQVEEIIRTANERQKLVAVLRAIIGAADSFADSDAHYIEIRRDVPEQARALLRSLGEDV